MYGCTQSIAILCSYRPVHIFCSPCPDDEHWIDLEMVVVSMLRRTVGQTWRWYKNDQESNHLVGDRPPCSLSLSRQSTGSGDFILESF